MTQGLQLTRRRQRRRVSCIGRAALLWYRARQGFSASPRRSVAAAGALQATRSLPAARSMCACSCLPSRQSLALPSTHGGLFTLFLSYFSVYNEFIYTEQSYARLRRVDMFCFILCHHFCTSSFLMGTIALTRNGGGFIS